MEKLFFLHKRNYKQRQTTFSTAYQTDIEAFNVSHKKHPLMCNDKYHARRTAFSLPTGLRGSMTLEATLLLPVFIFLMLNLYSVIDMLRLQATVTWYLHQIGNEVSAYGHLLGQEEKQDTIWDVIGDVGFSYLHIRDKVKEYVTFPDKVLVTTASILEEGEIELVLTYNYPLRPRLGKTKEVWLQSKYYSRAWGSEEMEEKNKKAYVTQNGEVYHLFIDCSHLCLSINQLPREYLQDYMLVCGKTLTPCTVCVDNGEAMVYITYEQGRYHFSEECGSLRRTIFEKELAWVEVRYKLCQRCKERNEKYIG